MRSLGYDNIALALRLTPSQWKEIKTKCQFRNPKDGSFVFLPEKIFFSEERNYVVCNINVPKLVREHNIILAEPLDLRNALIQSEQLLPIPLNLRDADVRSVHIAFTQGTSYHFDLSREVLIVPKRPLFRIYKEFKSGTYLNSKSRNMRFLLYDPIAKLRANGECLPQEVVSLCDHEHIIRAELRFDKSVRAQLEERGLWTLSSLRGSDLYKPKGFLAFVKLFQWRVPQFIITSKQKEEKEFTGEEKCLLTLSDKMLRLYKRECKTGRLSETDLSNLSNKILALQKRDCAKELLSGIQAECRRVYDCYEQRQPIAGKVEREGLIYARS